MNNIADFSSTGHGKVELFADRITIKKSKMATGKLLGQNPLKTIFLNQLDGILLENGGLRQGYIHFSTGGSSIKNKYSHLIKDENTIVFGMQGNKKALEFKAAVEKQISLSKNTSVKVVNATPADEIAKYNNLLQQGVITQEEFEQKKKQLLGL